MKLTKAQERVLRRLGAAKLEVPPFCFGHAFGVAMRLATIGLVEKVDGFETAFTITPAGREVLAGLEGEG